MTTMHEVFEAVGGQVLTRAEVERKAGTKKEFGRPNIPGVAFSSGERNQAGGGWGWGHGVTAAIRARSDNADQLWAALLALMDELGADQFEVQTGFSNPNGIAWGPDAVQWFAKHGAGKGIPVFVYLHQGRPVAVRGQKQQVGGRVRPAADGLLKVTDGWGKWK